ncbi:hypothetical protein DPM18_05710 [Polynucleobacter paneuropaeus]|uniref:AlbA family DNA-binding domain-containing protein n=1 Tax=Polynucleobacter paneuropaeus TaxID=2527775 RepID=UPI000DBEF8E0|nr:ATP-binding protein [Polynucleobacter paneuropaeus]AWW46342.1 hypothetical protein DPM18_05710 [Polynucleobacter paneuropaeus]
MFSVKFEEISEDHLRDLINSKISENSVTEFKQTLPTWDSSGKNEFLADISAMANHSGGFIFYGISESGDGSAAGIVPLDINPDQECRRIQDFILNNLEPKLGGYMMRAVPIKTGGYVLVINVLESWSKPHRVKINNHFYIREGARKRQLEMPEIKAAFINGDNLKKKITDFRADRVGKVLIGESPIRLVEGIVQVLHVLPYSCLYSNASVDVFRALDWSRIPVMSQNLGLSSKINIDGVVAHRVINPQGSGAYTQLFRNGMIESVRVFPPRSDTGELVLPSTSYEREIIEFLKGIKKVLTELDISGPMIILYSLLNVKNVQLGVSNNYLLDEGTGIFDRDQILLPDIVIEDMAIDEGMALRPLFDLVWNAAGFRQSLNYDQHSGVWVNS